MNEHTDTTEDEPSAEEIRRELDALTDYYDDYETEEDVAYHVLDLTIREIIDDPILDHTRLTVEPTDESDSMSNHANIQTTESPPPVVTASELDDEFDRDRFDAVAQVRDWMRVSRAVASDRPTVDALVRDEMDYGSVMRTAAGNPTGFAPAALPSDISIEDVRSVCEFVRDEYEERARTVIDAPKTHTWSGRSPDGMW